MSEQKKTVRPISQAFLSPNTRGPWRDSLPCGCVVVLERMTLGVFVQGIEQCPLHAAAPDLFVACEAIRNARDYNADYGYYPPGMLSEDQCFDDWAADIADKAIANAKRGE